MHLRISRIVYFIAAAGVFAALWMRITGVSAADMLRRHQSATSAPKADDAWIGVYTSTREIDLFSATTLVIERQPHGHLAYRMWFYSDVVGSDEGKTPEYVGGATVRGDHLYIDDTRHGQSPMEVTRLTRRLVTDRTVLFRDDALTLFEKQDQLYDYGVLIKISETLPAKTALQDAPRLSIRTLYRSGSKNWQDPFVHGPNAR